MPTFTYRRNLEREDWVRVVGVGVGAGVGVALAAGYLARIFLQRTPLDAPRVLPPPAPVLPAPPR